jgi:uncharacterized membrane protein
MDNMILIGIIVLGLILVIIAFIIILKSKSKPQPVKKTVKKVEDDYFDFDDLMAIAKNPNSSSEKLLEALEKFNSKFVIDDKNAQQYLIFLSRLLTHKNANKEIFQYFHKEIKQKNKKYKVELNSIEEKALG